MPATNKTDLATQAMLTVASHVTAQAFAEITWRGDRAAKTTRGHAAACSLDRLMRAAATRSCPAVARHGRLVNTASEGGRLRHLPRADRPPEGSSLRPGRSVFAVASGTMLAIALGALDGYAVSSLAATWQGADGAQREMLEALGTAVITIDHGILAMVTLTFLGLGLIAYGAASWPAERLPHGSAGPDLCSELPALSWGCCLQ